MKLNVLDAKKATKGSLDLPAQFSEPVRVDLIKRAVLALQANARTPYGTDPEAGKRSSAMISKRRRNYRGSYGHGISRTPRKIMSRNGNRMFWVGAFAPNTVGGRRAHPPKASKIWEQKVNKKENQKAIRSALAAVVDKTLVAQRGHKLPAEYPFLLDDSFEALTKTKDVETALVSLGFAAELDRSSGTTVRAGRAKMRGRKTKRATSLLIVVGSNDAKLLASGANVAGVDVVVANELNAELLAPGAHPGRATLFTEQAMQRIKNESLFLGKKVESAPKATSKSAAAKAAAPAATAKPKAAPKAKKTE